MSELPRITTFFAIEGEAVVPAGCTARIGLEATDSCAESVRRGTLVPSGEPHYRPRYRCRYRCRPLRSLGSRHGPGSSPRCALLATILLATGGLLTPGLASAQLLLPLDEPAATLDRATVAAAGSHHALLSVKRFGCYAVTVDSEQDVALQLVDRMAGPGAIVGRPGEEDGRRDVFLEGQPLLACRLAVNLEPGLYLVTAYGGREQPWAEDRRGERPFHLRMGIPRLGVAGRARYQVSPFGIDRYRLPAKASFFRLELPEARLAVLQVGRFAVESPSARVGTAARIEENSRMPFAEVTNGPEIEGEDVITFEAEAGQPYVLQHFEVRYHYRFRSGGRYWISSIHSGHLEDSVDATAILAEWTRDPLGAVVELRSVKWN